MDLIDLVILICTLFFLAIWWRSFSGKGSRDSHLPPGPPGWPLVGNLFQVILGGRHFIFLIRDLRKRYGPMFTMKMGQRTLVIVTSPDLIHEALVQRGSTFASRPPDSPIRLIFSVGKCAVNSAEYGPLWRTLRRNFVTELISPVRIKQCGWIREWALENHMKRLQEESFQSGFIDVMDMCRFTVCSILVCICFGAKITDEWIKDIDGVTKDVMLITMPQLPDFLPILTPLFYKQVKKAKLLRKKQIECLAPLIRNRRAFVEKGEDLNSNMVSPIGAAYVDSLLGLDVPGRGRLKEEELVTVCSELFVAGIDTSTSVLQWVFLELVLHQDIQEKLYDEIVQTVGKNGVINEEHVEKMTYLNAIVKETLRVHSPAHFTLSHAATEETELGGYKLPTNVVVEFYIEWMTEDPNLWKDPDVFRPERFLDGDGVDVDMTGTKGVVKMLPFGAGRRTCPGLSLGVLHVNLMMARMVQAFKWLPSPDYPPDPTETFAFTVVMKNPLKAVIVARAVDQLSPTASKRSLDLIQFGAVHYALVCPQPPPTATPEQIRVFKEVTAPSVLKKRASIKGKTVREAQKTFRITHADQFLEAGTYLRVHVHPKRFPRCYEIDWKSRIIAVEESYVVLDKPAGTSVGGTTDNIEESCATFATRALGITSPLMTTHQIDNCTEGCVVLARTKEYCSVFHGKLREKQVKKLYCALAASPVPIGVITHYMRPVNRAPRIVSEDFVKGWHICQLEVMDCKEVPWPNAATERKYCIEDSGWASKDFAYECKINLVTGRTHQIRAQLAACGAPLVGDSMYMPAAIAEMGNPGLNPFGKSKKIYHSEDDKEVDVTEWISRHGKEPTVGIGLQACQVSWDDGKHIYKAGSPWWRC